MSSSRIAVHSLRTLKTPRSCILCKSHQLTQPKFFNGAFDPSSSECQARTLNSKIWNRRYATQRPDYQRIRKDGDARSRLGFYQLSKSHGALRLEPAKADSIFKDFIHQKDNMNHGDNVKRLAQSKSPNLLMVWQLLLIILEYQVGLDDLSDLGIVTFKIPDLGDPTKRAKLPPSQHKPISALILQGCAQAEDPLAIVHILTAVYLSTTTTEPAVKEIARLFPSSEITKYRRTLQKLCLSATKFPLGPEALTLQGLFLENEGQKEKAKELYEEALLRSHLKYKAQTRNPMQLPLIAPWNALGFLLKSSKEPLTKADARKYFEMGALQGDDPLSYAELATFEPRSSTKWLHYTSKAAASGHGQAAVNLADFYEEVQNESSSLDSSDMRKALNWILGWKRDSMSQLAREWREVAAISGHKPSMLKLVDEYEAGGQLDKAKEYLRLIIEPPRTASKREEWPLLVQLAKKRLAGV